MTLENLETLETLETEFDWLMNICTYKLQGSLEIFAIKNQFMLNTCVWRTETMACVLTGSARKVADSDKALVRTVDNK